MTSHELIHCAVMMYLRLQLSLRRVEDLLPLCGIDVGNETIRYLLNRIRAGKPKFEPVASVGNKGNRLLIVSF